MKPFLYPAVVAAAIHLAVCGDARAEMVGVLAGEGAGALIRIDEATGAGTHFANAPTSLSGVAYSGSGRLFVTSGSGATNLLELNPATGAVLRSVAVLVGNNAGGVADIAFQPGSDVLFGVTANLSPFFGLGANSGGHLITIDLNSGAATVVGRDPQFGNQQGGIAFAPDGTLFFTPGLDGIGFLYRLNPATAAVLGTVALSSNIGFMGLAVRPGDGLLFASGPPSINDNDMIYTVAAATGVVTEVGQAGTIFKVHDLAFIPPRTGAPTLAPSALLVAAGLIAAAGFRRLRARHRP